MQLLLNTKMVFLLVVCGVAYGQDMCRTLEFTQPKHGQALRGHVFKKIFVETQENCRLNCFLENDCVSYNLDLLMVNNKFTCELSDSDHREHPADLQPKHGFLYGSTKKNPCSKSPCSPHGNCQNGFTDKGYRCKCHTGFTGQACDQLIWLKINTAPVCFGTRDETYGSFTITLDGSVGAFRLVHLSGILVCHPSSTRSFWGCEVPAYGDKTLLTIISFPRQRSVLLPRQSSTQMGVPGVVCATEFTYKLNGLNDTSPEIVFNTTSEPLTVVLHQEFHIMVWTGYGRLQ